MKAVAHLPCGKSPSGDAVSCVEAATLVGIQEWVTSNRPYFKKTNLRNYLLMIGFGVLPIDIVFVSGIFFALGLIMIVSGIVLHFTRTIVPVDFPIPVITTHPWAYYRGVPQLVSNGQYSQKIFTLKGAFDSYSKHDPSRYPSNNLLSEGIRDFSHISLVSLQSLREDINSYYSYISDFDKPTILTHIISGGHATQILNYSVPLISAEQASLCSKTSRIQQAEIENQSTQTSFNEIQRIIDSNRANTSLFHNQSRIDILPYQEWGSLLSSIGDQWAGSVLLSASDGWERMADASGNASEFLTRSVQDRIEEIKARIDADAREAEAELEAKMVDIESEIAAKDIDLQHQVAAQQNVLVMAQRTTNNIEKVTVPSTITFNIPVAMVSGGGGRIGEGGGFVSGVSTTVKWESVSMDNPAYQIRGHMIELANSASRIEEARLGGLEQQRVGLGNLAQERREGISKRKDERKAEADSRMEEEREVALKHAHSVEDLFVGMEDNDEKIDYRDFNRIMSTVWNRPASIVRSIITPTEQEIATAISNLANVEQEARDVEAELTFSALSGLAVEELNAHWVVYPNGSITENFFYSPLEVFEEGSIAARESNLIGLLAPQLSIQPVAMTNDTLQNTISYLSSKGWFGTQLNKYISKMSPKDFRSNNHSSSSVLKAGLVQGAR
jgi:hypothetical protein